MRTLVCLVIFTSLFSGACFSQVFKYDSKTESVTFTAPDSMSVQESFKFVKKLIPSGLCAHTRYVSKDGKKYMRKYYVHNALFRRTYLIDESGAKVLENK